MNPSRNFSFVLSAVVQLFILTGCSFQVPNYPSQMPPLVPVDKNQDIYLLVGNEVKKMSIYNTTFCREGMRPSIAGHYSDKGSVNGKSKPKVSLSQLLHNAPFYAQADTVVVVEGTRHIQTRGCEQNYNYISEIQSLKNGQPFAKWSHMDSDPNFFLWTNVAQQLSGLLVIKKKQDECASFFLLCYAFLNWDAVCMGKAVDGSLIVLHSKGSGGFIGLFPFRFSDDKWYRFEPIKENSSIKLEQSLN